MSNIRACTRVDTTGRSSRLSCAAAELVSPTIDQVIDSAASCGRSDYESGGREFESLRAANKTGDFLRGGCEARSVWGRAGDAN